MLGSRLSRQGKASSGPLAARTSAELGEECGGRAEVMGIVPLREPAVHRLEDRARLAAVAAIAEQTGVARRCAERERLRLLPARDRERVAERDLRGRLVAADPEQFSLETTELGVEEPVEHPLRPRLRVAHHAQPLVGVALREMGLDEPGAVIRVRPADADRLVDPEALLDLRDPLDDPSLAHGGPALRAEGWPEPEDEFLLGRERDAPVG